MANERLADLTDADIEQYVLDNPTLFYKLSSRDPRAQLHARLYGNADARKDLEAVIQKHKALFPDRSSAIDVPDIAKEAIADDVAAVKKLRKELEDDRQSSARRAFREGLRAHAEAFAATVQDADLDKIEQFMVDNQYGPKAAAVAVEKFYDTQNPAEPNFESAHTFQFEDEGSDYIKKLVAAGPGEDTRALTMQHAEQVYRDMFGRGAANRRPAFTA